MPSLVGSEMCIRDRRATGHQRSEPGEGRYGCGGLLAVVPGRGADRGRQKTAAAEGTPAAAAQPVGPLPGPLAGRDIVANGTRDQLGPRHVIGCGQLRQFVQLGRGHRYRYAPRVSFRMRCRAPACFLFWVGHAITSIRNGSTTSGGSINSGTKSGAVAIASGVQVAASGYATT